MYFSKTWEISTLVTLELVSVEIFMRNVSITVRDKMVQFQVSIVLTLNISTIFENEFQTGALLARPLAILLASFLVDASLRALELFQMVEAFQT